MHNYYTTISPLSDKCQTVEQSLQGNVRRSPQKSPHRQLPLFDPLQPEQNYPLEIELLPDALQWWDEPRYWLTHKDSGLRVPGSFNEKEALYIRHFTKDWDWTVDTRDRKVACGLNLLSLAEIVCQGGEG
jgi:hypothetical protein